MTTFPFRSVLRYMVAVVVLAAAWPCPIAFGNHYILCQNEKCDVFEIPDEPKGPGNAGWTVDQVYSNANGSIQYIVLLKGGGQECRDLSVFSIHDGETSGVIWPNFKSGPDSFDHLLIATTGFGILGIVQPNAWVHDGFLGTGAGVIRVCDTEYHYAALPTDGVRALNASGSVVTNVATNLARVSRSVTAEQAASTGFFREGLTGSWYDRATSGQGFEVEVAADYLNFGANVMLSWFTYDHTTAGGAERQRWYTLFGHVGVGAGAWPLQLDIFQNVGGNFNAAPTTAGQKIGTASLKFTACDEGKLDYTFSDGSNRSGSIPITRLTQNVTCYTTGAVPPANSDFALSGNWYDPATSGQGITVEINPVSGVAFLAWYTYAPGGAQLGAAGQRWYTAQSTYASGARTVEMTIYETTGGLFDSSISLPRSIAVGTATLAFESCRAATLTYSFTGGSSQGTKGTMPLSRVISALPDCGT